jgi:hypothetical protein
VINRDEVRQPLESVEQFWMDSVEIGKLYSSKRASERAVDEDDQALLACRGQPHPMGEHLRLCIDERTSIQSCADGGARRPTL